MILEILCTRARTAGSLANLVRGLAEVPSSHPPPGGRRAHGHPLKSRGSLWSRKDGRSETCPRPESPRPDPLEPRTQAPPTQFPSSPRRLPTPGAAADLRGATLGVLGSVFLSPFFYSLNPTPNAPVRENAPFTSARKKKKKSGSSKSTPGGSWKGLGAAEQQTVSLIDRLSSLYILSRRNGKGVLQKATTAIQV